MPLYRFTQGRRPWHRHYTRQEIQAFFPPALALHRHAVYFPGMQAMLLLRITLRVACVNLIKPFPPPLPWLERRLSRTESPCGDQLVMLFKKRVPDRAGQPVSINR